MPRSTFPPFLRPFTRPVTLALALCGVVATSGAAHAQGLFKPPAPTLPTGTMPQAVAAADLALSGYQSLAVADTKSNNLKVFLATGPGTFGAGFTYAACTGPTAVVSQDVNNDGYPDLFVACPSANMVDVFLNQGASAPGTFGGAIPFSINDPVAMASGNFAGGTSPGLAIASGSGGITVLLDESGNLVTKTAAVSGSLTGIAAGDFNHDGNLDLAISDSSGNDVHVLTGDGTGSFTAAGTYPAGTAPSGIASADMNRDGSLDLAVSNAGSNNVTVLLGSPAGTFTPVPNAQSAGIDPLGLVITDVNSDGFPDVVAFDAKNSGSTSQGAVAVLLGNGDGTLQVPQVSNLSTVPGTQAAVADFNRDGKPDLAVAGQTTNQVLLLINNTLPTQYGNGRSFATYTAVPSGNGNMADGIATGDFNKDGRLDIAVSYLEDNAVRVMMNNGGNFGAAAVYAVGRQPYWIASGDLNGDGFPDLVTSNTTDGTISVLLNKGKSGNGTFAAASTYTVGRLPYQVAIGDLNGDGYGDIVVANYGADTVSILWGSKSGTFTNGPVLNTGTNPYGVAIGDFEHNGHPGIAVTCYHTAQLYVFGNNGDGTFATPAIYTTNSNPGSIALADFNRDGNLDIVTGDSIANDLSFFAGHGDGTFSSGVTSPSLNFPISIAAGDVNGDGIPDIVGVAPNYQAVSVVLGKGDGTFGSFYQRAQFGAPKQPWAVALGDFNNDGNLDIATANTYSQVNLAIPAYIYMYMNKYPPVSGGSPSVDLLLNSSAAAISMAVTPDSFPLPPVNSGVTLTATVQPALSGPTPTGSVIFEDNTGAPLGTGPYGLSGGNASYTTGQLGSGQYLFTTLYSGDTNFQPTTASGTGFAVTVAGTPVTLTLSSNSVNYGSTVTATVSVTGNGTAGAPQGTVTIYGAPGNFTLAPITLAANGNNSFGSETFAVTAPDFNVGTYQLYGYFTPSNGAYQAGTSSSVQLAVAAEPTQLALNCPTGFLGSTCTATVTDPTTGAAIHPGLVQFTGPAGNQNNALNANGVAAYSFSQAFGGYTVTAYFPAQGNFKASAKVSYSGGCFFFCTIPTQPGAASLNSLTGTSTTSSTGSGAAQKPAAKQGTTALPLF